MDLIRADENKVKSPGIMDEQTDHCYQQDDEEASSRHEEKDVDDACEQDDKEVLNAHGEVATDYDQPNFSSVSGEEIGQDPPDHATNHTEHHLDDQFPDYTESESAPTVTGLQKLDSVDEHPSTGPMNVPLPIDLSNLPGPPPQEKLPPSERYKPRRPPDALPARPSLTRAPATYDSRLTDDSERRSAKRVSFQQDPTPLYTPSSTSNSSPVSPSTSPQLPFRTVLAKPPPVSIPPGQYTPVASSSSSPSGSHISTSSSPPTRKPYTCLEPTCDSSFDHPHDRDRHELQHQIGDPPYSQCKCPFRSNCLPIWVLSQVSGAEFSSCFPSSCYDPSNFLKEATLTPKCAGPICRNSRSSGLAVNGGLRELLIAHMNRRH